MMGSVFAMKHELVQARNATGMRLRGQNSMLCGYYRGFAMVTNLNSKARCYDVVVWATRSGADMSQEANQWLADYAAQHPFCTGGSYNGQLLVAQIAIDKKRDITAQSLLTFYNDVVGWLAANGMASCCESCGAPDAALFDMGGKLHAICPRCLEQMSQAARAEQKAVPGNLPAGIAGAILFSLAGVALWVLVNEKFSGKLDTPGIIICIIVAVCMGLVSQYVCIGLDIYEVFGEYGVGLLDCMRAVPGFLFDPELNLLSDYLPDLLMGYAFMVLGSFSFVRNALAAQKHGGFLIEKLAERPGGANTANVYTTNTYK